MARKGSEGRQQRAAKPTARSQSQGDEGQGQEAKERQGRSQESTKKVRTGDAARAGLEAYHENVKKLGHEMASDAAWTAQVKVQQKDNDRKDLIVGR